MPAVPRSRFAGLRMRLGVGRRGPAGEDAYRVKRVRGALYYTSRQEHQSLTIFVERFPGPEEPGARTFVLVHGIGVSSRYFRPLAAELSTRGRVFLVDLPGYGAAPDPRRDVTIADHAEVLASFLQQLGVEDAVIVGHSWGCQVVSMLARRHPDVPRTVVLLSPTLEPSARTPAKAIGHLLHDATREPPAVFWIAVTDYLVRCGLGYLLRQMRHMLADRPEDRVGEHRAHTLVVNGDRDPIVSTTWARRLADAHPDGEFHEVRGPHVIMHTEPATIAQHIVRFVTQAG
ncbi:alpha/beta fold hydrolase [Pseudolysinimonas sp.]